MMGITNIAAQLSNLLNIIGDKAEQLGLDPGSIDTLRALLIKIQNKIEDGIQPHEIEDLKLLLRELNEILGDKYKPAIEKIIKQLVKLQKHLNQLIKEELIDEGLINPNMPIEQIIATASGLESKEETNTALAGAAAINLNISQNTLTAQQTAKIDNLNLENIGIDKLNSATENLWKSTELTNEKNSIMTDLYTVLFELMSNKIVDAAAELNLFDPDDLLKNKDIDNMAAPAA